MDISKSTCTCNSCIDARVIYCEASIYTDSLVCIKIGLSFTDLPSSEIDVTAVVCGVIFGLLLLGCGVVTLVVVALFLFKRQKSIDSMSESIVTRELQDTSSTESSSITNSTNNKQIESGAISTAAPPDSFPTSAPLHLSTAPTSSSASSSDHPSVPLSRFTSLRVDNDCELKEFVEKKNGLAFKRGCCFYQFTHDVEKIRDNQEVVLMNKVNFLNVSTLQWGKKLWVHISWIGDPANINMCAIVVITTYTML